MLNISLTFNKKDFEYDVYSLVRAFYPGSQVKMFYTPEAEEAAADQSNSQGDALQSQARETVPAEEMEYDKTYTITYLPEEIIFAAGDGTAKSAAVSEKEDRVVRKNLLKQLVYQTLSQETGRELPWGDLTGIRPTKIPMGLLEQGWKNTEIAEHMRNTYFCSPAKTALALATANREKAILQEFDYKTGYSLYVGIPFCPSICLYCSFGSHALKTWKHMIEPYLEALFKELDFIAEKMKGWRLDTVYIGGGTPTSLEAEQLDRLLGKIQASFDLKDVREFTVEAGRPDTITGDKLAAIRKYPVTRISINPQTMNQNTLELIGRKHTVEETIQVFKMARDMGFDNINMDLIVGLPGEGKAEVAHTLEQVKQLDPESLTVHSLALKRATRLNLFKDQYEEISFENSAEIMEMTEHCAREMEMGPYYLYRQKNIAGNFENVGYSKVDKYGIYNILIMEEKQTIMAAGSGASTKFVFQNGERIERVENVKDLKNYVERIDEMLERKQQGIDQYLGR
ncbi:MAG: coproporphyrinogen dehydrogenase HemZ [Lachnospiraceae bacterium]|nr:coproporphyrinogen dehydrogenase HemZ [Lachnospiraceae bacterium]